MSDSEQIRLEKQLTQQQVVENIRHTLQQALEMVSETSISLTLSLVSETEDGSWQVLNNYTGKESMLLPTNAELFVDVISKLEGIEGDEEAVEQLRKELAEFLKDRAAQIFLK